MIIQHNMAAMFANRELNISEKNRASSAEKLSSGYRINRAADDAAGLTISEKMRWQIRGLDKASNNIEDGMSLIQVADGALNESHAILQRMNELAVQAANDTNTNADRDAIQLEMDELADELTRIAETTTYNSEIYPLASGGVTKIGLPSTLSEVTLTIVNDKGKDVYCNGVCYKDGETMVINNVAWYDTNYRRAFIGLFGRWPDGTNSGAGEFNIQISDYSKTHKLSDLSNGATSLDSFVFEYGTLDEIKVDENGYLYFDVHSLNAVDAMGSNNIRHYLTQTNLGIATIQDTNGSYTGTPLPEKCEAAGCARLDSSASQGRDEIKIQSGALAYQSIDIPLVDAKASTLGVEFLDVMTHTYATKAIDTIGKAIEKVSEYRSMFGAVQNRLEHAQANVDNTALNVQSSESKIRDTDMAKEMVSNSAASIISQTAQSMLAQSNQMTQGVLKLLE